MSVQYGISRNGIGAAQSVKESYRDGKPI